MKLTKRELLLVSLLLAVALIFGGFRFVWSPIQQRNTELAAQLSDIESQKSIIDVQLKDLETSNTKKTELLSKINTATAPFFSGISEESLLLYLHDTILSNGLVEGIYGISSQKAIRITSSSQSDLALVYPIGQIADDYRALEASGTSVTPTPTTGAAVTPCVSDDRNVIVWTVQLSITGTYEQLKTFLSELEALNRAVTVDEATWIFRRMFTVSPATC